MSVVLRSSGRDPLAVLPSVRAAIGELDPALPLAHVHTMEERIGASLARTRILHRPDSDPPAGAITS